MVTLSLSNGARVTVERPAPGVVELHAQDVPGGKFRTRYLTEGDVIALITLLGSALGSAAAGQRVATHAARGKGVRS